MWVSIRPQQKFRREGAIQIIVGGESRPHGLKKKEVGKLYARAAHKRGLGTL